MGFSLYVVLLLVIFNVGFVLGACWVSGRSPVPGELRRRLESGMADEDNRRIFTSAAGG